MKSHNFTWSLQSCTLPMTHAHLAMHVHFPMFISLCSYFHIYLFMPISPCLFRHADLPISISTNPFSHARLPIDLPISTCLYSMPVSPYPSHHAHFLMPISSCPTHTNLPMPLLHAHLLMPLLHAHPHAHLPISISPCSCVFLPSTDLPHDAVSIVRTVDLRRMLCYVRCVPYFHYLVTSPPPWTPTPC